MSSRKLTGLSYYLPKPAKPHTALRIPESHTLFAGPGACARRHAMHAFDCGDAGNVSFLSFSESEIALGSYEDAICDAVSELIDVLADTPKIFFITLFCISDLLATDDEALLDALRIRFPKQQFAVNHINPVALNEKRGMGDKKLINLYTFISPGKRKDEGVNFLGNFVSLEPDCEFLALLKSWDVQPVREIISCKTYEDYQAMGKSRLNIVMRHIASGGAEYMKEAFGIDYFNFPADYDADFITRAYKKIAAMLGKRPPELDGTAAFEDAKQTAAMLGGLPVAIDAGAFLRPFAAAKALLGYGFNVKYIMRSRHKYDADAEERDYIAENFPQIMVFLEDEYVKADTHKSTDMLAIGNDCRRALDGRYFADVWRDEGFFGYHGIHRLMALLRAAVTKEDV